MSTSAVSNLGLGSPNGPCRAETSSWKDDWKGKSQAGDRQSTTGHTKKGDVVDSYAVLAAMAIKTCKKGTTVKKDLRRKRLSDHSQPIASLLDVPL